MTWGDGKTRGYEVTEIMVTEKLVSGENLSKDIYMIKIMPRVNRSILT